MILLLPRHDHLPPGFPGLGDDANPGILCRMAAWDGFGPIAFPYFGKTDSVEYHESFGRNFCCAINAA
jgi:hypothetical protein